MTDISHLSKQLYLELKENEEKYMNEELDLTDILKKTDEIYNNISLADKPSASDFLDDSNLLTLESKIVRQSARTCQVHNLSFNPRNFSMKTRNYFGIGNLNESCESSQRKLLATLWTKLGQCSKAVMRTVPTFNYIYGTFSADAVPEPVRKKRKLTVKDKIGELTKPQEVDLSLASTSQDIMCVDASRILSCFLKLTQNSKKKAVCFYEFVVDPTSFTKTVEHVFLVSLLVQHGELCIYSDDQGLPFIKKVESKDGDTTGSISSQAALSISMEEWKEKAGIYSS